MNNYVFLFASAIVASGCTSQNEQITRNFPLPTCEQIVPILNSSTEEFDEIKSGPKIVSDSYNRGYWKSSITLPGADECIVRTNYSSGTQFRCVWYHGDDKQSMGQHYQALRDRIISCVGDVQVIKRDNEGYTFIDLEPFGNLSFLRYSIRAKYENMPYAVRFDVEAK